MNKKISGAKIESDAIFQKFYPYSNDSLISLNESEIQEFLFLLSNYLIKLRTNLNINERITFGLELEFEKVLKYKMNKVKKRDNYITKWSIKEDESLNKGLELISPILIDKKETWIKLKNICNEIQKFASISCNSASHIHIGTQIIGDNKISWINFFKLWSTYENIIYRFSYGEFISPRPTITYYAKPISKEFYELYNEGLGEISIKELLDKYCNSDKRIFSLIEKRYKGVNLSNVNLEKMNKILYKNTIEFRCPNGTLNPIIWQNNINVFIKVLEYSKNKKFNNEVIDNRNLINQKYKNNLLMYNQIYLEEALEFCDLIFNNNIDKINFLKQYLKTFNSIYNFSYKKVKKLTDDKFLTL